YFTVHLEMFTVQEITVSGSTKIGKKEILKRSGLRPGEISIFFFETSVEQNISKNPWVKSVSVVKEFPKKVQINIEEEQAYCLMVNEDGDLIYLSKEGKRLGPSNFELGLDFPVLI
ncbi:MAG: FtsQ-type POTRA domain-containing protein, partial [Candidatus Thorarchaeota archaeon]|nr:FtsQ-type POTRA domain-containing protein [Candidatus Thorarchaeota archaeon]